MKYFKGNFLYLANLFLFKLVVGGILLITSWDALSLSNNSLLNISLLMGLSFSPATFSRALFFKIKNFNINQQITSGFFSAFILLSLEYYLLNNKSIYVFVVNFLLWIVIFLIEVIFEKWFVGLSQFNSLTNARKLSGISTSMGQLGLIIGPLLMIFLKQLSYSLPYYFCIFVFFIVGIAPLAFKLPFDNNCEDKSSSENKKSQNKLSLLYTIAFALIWPTIAIFNITAPLLAKNQFDSINVAGVMEFLIGSAMATIGFFHIKATQYFHHTQRVYFVVLMLALSTTLIFLFPQSRNLIFSCTFIIGLTFGYLRIELRTFLSQKYSSEQAGEIIARANSWSGPLVLIYCSALYFEGSLDTVSRISIVFPISFILGAIVICFLLINDSHFIKERT